MMVRLLMAGTISSLSITVYQLWKGMSRIIFHHSFFSNCLPFHTYNTSPMTRLSRVIMFHIMSSTTCLVIVNIAWCNLYDAYQFARTIILIYSQVCQEYNINLFYLRARCILCACVPAQVGTIFLACNLPVL